MKVWRLAAAVLVVGFPACGDDEDGAVRRRRADSTSPGDTAGVATMLGPRERRMTREQLERGLRDPSWRRYIVVDTIALADPASPAEKWDDISAQTVNGGRARLPLAGAAEGPTVLKIQVLLDRALFSPGIIDGRLGKNSEKALYWLQSREGLRATGVADTATYRRLGELAGGVQELVVEHTLTEDDVAGPFVRIPDDIYKHAELECSCYESLAEKLAEQFHTSPELLERLNPGVELDALGAGATLWVPNVRGRPASPADRVAELVVSDGGHYLHARDAAGRILYHFPTTLGSEYNPSPSGEFSVTSVTRDPWWHYQPELLEGVPDDEEDARIPPGPNNAVGVVWMQLSKPHYGIHGTTAPETIGYVTSSGCVRLTNWDAGFLAGRVARGTPVRFRDVTPGGRGD